MPAFSTRNSTPVQQIWGAVVRGNIHAREIGSPAAPRDAVAPLTKRLRRTATIRLPTRFKTHQRAQQSRLEVARLEKQVLSRKGNVRFSDEQGLNDQLWRPSRPCAEPKFIHDWHDNTLPEEFNRLCPRSGCSAPHVRRFAGFTNMASTSFRVLYGAGGSDFRRLANAG